nr:p33 [Neodiprion sertifer nucleopolyhedrovirus]
MTSDLMYRYIDMLKFEIETLCRQIFLNIGKENYVAINQKEVTYYLQIFGAITHQNISDSFITNLMELCAEHKNFDMAYQQLLVKTNLINLQAENKKPSIGRYWDLIHLLSFVVDDIVSKRHKYDYKLVDNKIQNLYRLIANIYVKLGCSVCVEHYLLVRGMLLEPIERLRVSMLLEYRGMDIQTVPLNEDDDTAKVIPQNLCLYTSFRMHNHINNFRMIQRYKADSSVIQQTKQLQLYNPLVWSDYKKLLFE